MKIGIIGAGHIGATLGKLFVDAGHEVVFGLRTPADRDELIQQLGARARAAAIPEALKTDVVVFAGPYGAWPEFARGNASALDGKVVIDAANPYPERDGGIAEAAVRGGHGSGAYTASLIPRAHVVKAFNTVYWVDLRDKAHRSGERIAMAIAGDDVEAMSIASRLATDAGFEPVAVGGLSRSMDLDPGSSIYAKSFTASEVKKALLLKA